MSGGISALGGGQTLSLRVQQLILDREEPGGRTFEVKRNLSKGNVLAILVVGGAGYIGSHVARTLRRHGYEAIIYDNLCAGHAFLAHGFELVVADIADSEQLTKVMGRVDAVMHFAAFASVGESVQNPRIYFRNNAKGGLNLLNTALDAGVRRFIFSSTCAV